MGRSPAAPSLTPKAVVAWLRRNPDFLRDNPEVLPVLTPPEYRRDDGVTDMQRFMLDRLRREVASLHRREKQLLSTVEGNAAGQTKIHRAVLALIDAPDMQALNLVLRTELPSILDLEAVVLCVEGEGALALAGAMAIGPDGVAGLLGPRRRFLLLGDTAGTAAVFGDAAERVRSIAYLRLRRTSPKMLLALGSGRGDGFDSRQGTDLIAFLADALELRIRHCLQQKR